MSELYEKSLYKLELDQVLQLLAECAGSSEGKAACVKVMPSSDLDVVREMLAETTAASDLCTRKGNPSFTDVKDVGPLSVLTEAAAFSVRNCWPLPVFCAVLEILKAMWQRMIRKQFWIRCSAC